MKIDPHRIELANGTILAESPAGMTVESFPSESGGIPACPRCHGTRCVRNGTTYAGKERFRCKDCRRSFGRSCTSPFFASKTDCEKWSLFIQCLKQRKSLRECARICDISLPTALAWRRKTVSYLANILKEFLRAMQAKGLCSESVDMLKIGRRIDVEAEQCFRLPPGRKKLPWTPPHYS